MYLLYHLNSSLPRLYYLVSISAWVMTPLSFIRLTIGNASSQIPWRKMARQTREHEIPGAAVRRCLCRIQPQSRYPLHHFLVIRAWTVRICSFYYASSCRLRVEWFMLRTRGVFRLEVQHFVKKTSTPHFITGTHPILMTYMSSRRN